MNKKCKDPVFGAMTYKYRWYKEEPEETIFGKVYKIIIAASAYSEKPITDEQRTAYKEFQEKKSELYNQAGRALIRYINANLDEIAEYWPAARKIGNVNELVGVVEPTTLLVKQDGTILLLLECVWDRENGVAVKLSPDITVGPQDLFL